MQRRTALKQLGLSFGALTMTPSVMSLLQSCQTNDATWSPAFFTQENARFVEKITDIILPTTANSPGAIALNLIRFIDSHLATIAGEDEQKFIQSALDLFAGLTQSSMNKSSIEELRVEDIDAQLNRFLRATEEEKEERASAFSAYEKEVLAGESSSPPLEGICHELLHNLRSLTIKAFRGNEIIAKEHMVYVPVPGEFRGCVDLQEATQGKDWAL